MKKIILIFAVAILVTIGCAKKDINPLSPDVGHLTTDEKPLNLSSIVGTLMNVRDSVGVEPTDEASWIYIYFDDVVNTASTGIKVEETDGDEVAYTYEWSVSGGRSDLLMKPTSSLNHNTTYILKLIAGDVFDVRGNYLDMDGDEVGGESPDDDYIYPFATFRSDETKGNWPVYDKDTIGPWRSGGAYFIDKDGNTTGLIWRDINIAIDVFDTDASLATVAADPNTINETTVMIIERNTGEEFPLASVTYEDNDTEPEFGRITVNPDGNLKAGTIYDLRLLGSIADTAGNKLDEVDYIHYEYGFMTRACDFDSTECADDIVPPTVIDWDVINEPYNGAAFEVEFSEVIDESTISLSTVYLSYPGYVDGGLSIRNEGGHTIVRFTRGDGGSVYGYTGYVTSEVKDMAGNRKGWTSSHSF